MAKEVTQDTIIIPFNDAEVANKRINKNKDEVVAVLVEPVMFNVGCVPQKRLLKSDQRFDRKQRKRARCSTILQYNS